MTELRLECVIPAKAGIQGFRFQRSRMGAPSVGARSRMTGDYFAGFGIFPITSAHFFDSPAMNCPKAFGSM